MHCPPLLFSVGIYQSDDSSFMLYYLISCAVISFGVNMNGTIISVSLYLCSGCSRFCLKPISANSHSKPIMSDRATKLCFSSAGITLTIQCISLWQVDW